MSRFPTTRWSAVRGLRSAEDAERRRSWDAVTAAYWRPVYKHLRLRWKRSPEDAEDLTQSFFAHALERSFLERYDPEKARFRTFVRTCLDRFVANDAKGAARQKRGGAAEKVSIDVGAAEEELAKHATRAEATPEELFDREWNRALFASAIEELRAECAANGRESTFAIFEQYDLGEGAERPTYDALAKEHGVPATTITNRLALARRELRRIVLAKLEPLTDSDAEYADEARRLFGEGA